MNFYERRIFAHSQSDHATEHLTKYRRAAVAANRCSPVLLRVQGCGARLKPKPGDCCVFCSYGSVPCPPIQAERVGEHVAPSCCAI